MANDINTLPKFMLKPFADGYNVTLADDFISTPMQGGEPRQRRIFEGGWHQVSATYKHRPAAHQYFLAFRRAYAGRSFLAYLLVDDAVHRWYRCRFIDNKKLSPRYGGGMFTASCELSVEPIPYAYDKDGNLVAYPHTMDNDLSMVAIYNMTDGQTDLFFNKLEKLVNQDLPAATAGLK